MADLLVPQACAGFHIECSHSPADFRGQLEKAVLDGLIVYQQNAVLVTDGNLSSEYIVVVSPKDLSRSSVHRDQRAAGMFAGFQ